MYQYLLFKREIIYNLILDVFFKAFAGNMIQVLVLQPIYVSVARVQASPHLEGD